VDQSFALDASFWNRRDGLENNYMSKWKYIKKQKTLHHLCSFSRLYDYEAKHVWNAEILRSNDFLKGEDLVSLSPKCTKPNRGSVMIS
jgi:hypothetical protein